MNKKDIEAFAKEAAKGIKTPEDLNQFSQMLKKITVEAAHNAEMDDHLGYEKHRQSSSVNSRNGRTSKRIQTEDGQFELDTPRDRDGSFEPKLVKKHQSRFTSMDGKILWLYAQGMSTRDIVQAFDEWYGAEISPTLVSRVTNAVLEQVIEWQSRPLDAIYPIVYLDCIVIKIRQDKRVISKSIFLVRISGSSGHLFRYAPIRFGLVWFGDVTYIWTGQRRSYIAVIMDLFVRILAGLALPRSPDNNLTKQALNMANELRGHPSGEMFHSDKSSHCTRISYLGHQADHIHSHQE
jgi:hypothetical protein